MLQTVEAFIDRQGQIRLIEPLVLPIGGRVLVTILSEQAASRIEQLSDTANVDGHNTVKSKGMGLVEFFRQSPFYDVELDLVRDKEPAREIEL